MGLPMSKFFKNSISIACVLASCPLLGIINTWVGGAAGLETDWNEPTNWSANAVPVSGADFLRFPNNTPFRSIDLGATIYGSLQGLDIDSDPGAPYTFTSSTGNFTWDGNSFDVESGVNHLFGIPIQIDTNGVLGISASEDTSVNFSGNISGMNGRVEIQNDGIVTFSGTNTYTGSTIMDSSGTLKAGSTSAFPSTSAFNLGGSESKLDLGGFSNTILSLVGEENSIVTNSGGSTATLTISSVDPAEVFFNGTLVNGTSPLGLTLAGNTYLITGGENTYSGPTTIGVGTILQSQPNNETSLSSNSAYTVNGALRISEESIAIASLQGGATGVVESSQSEVNLTITNGNNLTYSGLIQDGDGEFGFTLANGTLTLDGTATNTYPTIVNSGATLITGSATALSSESPYTLNGTLNMNGFSNSMSVLSGAGTLQNTGALSTLTFTGNTVNDGTFSGNIAGLIALTLDGNGPEQTLSGTNTYSGDTTISVGILVAGAAGALSPNSNLIIGQDGLLELLNFNQTIKSLSGDGNIQGGGTAGTRILTIGGTETTTYSGQIFNGTGGSVIGLALIGAGSLTLEGNNVYSGGTSINSGATLLLANGGSIGGGNLTVNGTFNATGIQQKGSLDSHAQWLGNDCGTVKPRA